MSIVNKNNTQSVMHDYDNGKSKLSQDTGDLWLNKHSNVQNHSNELNEYSNAAIQLHNDTQIMVSMEVSIEDNVAIWVSVNSK